MNHLVLLLLVLFVFVFLYQGLGQVVFFFALLAGLYVFLVVTAKLVGFLAGFVKEEAVEVEKSSGSEPSGKDLEGVLEDGVDTLLNLNDPKGSTTKRIGKGAKEFLKKGAKLFKNG